MKSDRESIETILSAALEKGASDAEVFFVKSSTLRAEAKQGDIELLENSRTSGFSLRLLKDSKQGFGYSTDMDNWESVVDNALETALFTKKDKHLNFPESSVYKELSIYDKEAAIAGEEDIIERAVELERIALGYDKRIAKVRKASASVGTNEIYIANSKSLFGYSKGTFCSAYVIAIAESGNESRMGSHSEDGRFLNDLSVQRVGEKASHAALSLLDSNKITTARLPVILDNTIAGQFLGFLAASFSSENIQKGKSLFIGKRDQHVISEKINIVDDATIERKTGTRPFDAEGVPSIRNELIVKGTLTGVLYNTYTASKDCALSTGNAVRGGLGSSVGVGVSNLYLEPASGNSEFPVQEMISSLDRGLLITEAMGMHTVNPFSGDFSIGIGGMLIEKGKLSFPFREAVFTGNIIEIYKNIITIGDDLTFNGRLGSPSLLISDVDISA